MCSSQARKGVDGWLAARTMSQHNHLCSYPSLFHIIGTSQVLRLRTIHHVRQTVARLATLLIVVRDGLLFMLPVE